MRKCPGTRANCPGDPPGGSTTIRRPSSGGRLFRRSTDRSMEGFVQKAAPHDHGPTDQCPAPMPSWSTGRATKICPRRCRRSKRWGNLPAWSSTRPPRFRVGGNPASCARPRCGGQLPSVHEGFLGVEEAVGQLLAGSAPRGLPGLAAGVQVVLLSGWIRRGACQSRSTARSSGSSPDLLAPVAGGVGVRGKSGRGLACLTRGALGVELTLDVATISDMRSLWPRSG
jgi:hypothetical protein